MSWPIVVSAAMLTGALLLAFWIIMLTKKLNKLVESAMELSTFFDRVVPLDRIVFDRALTLKDIDDLDSVIWAQDAYRARKDKTWRLNLYMTMSPREFQMFREGLKDNG
jgi:hypothetical protein